MDGSLIRNDRTESNATCTTVARKGNTVRPVKWSNVLDLFDAGYNSAIWGNYEHNPQRCLGVRYNGEGQKIGYPNKENFPLWYVEPDFVTRNILLDLMSRINNKASVGKLDNVLLALREFDARRNPPAAEPNPE